MVLGMDARDDSRQRQTVGELHDAVQRVMEAVQALPSDVEGPWAVQIWYASAHTPLTGACRELARVSEITRRHR